MGVFGSAFNCCGSEQKPKRQPNGWEVVVRFQKKLLSCSSFLTSPKELLSSDVGLQVRNNLPTTMDTDSLFFLSLPPATPSHPYEQNGDDGARVTGGSSTSRPHGSPAALPRGSLATPPRLQRRRLTCASLPPTRPIRHAR